MEHEQSYQQKRQLRKITPRGKFNKDDINYSEDVTLTPEEDEKINRMTAEADAEIDQRKAKRQQNK